MYINKARLYNIHRFFFSAEKMKFSSKQIDIFNIFAQNIDCGYMLETPRRGGSNEFPQSVLDKK